MEDSSLVSRFKIQSISIFSRPAVGSLQSTCVSIIFTLHWIFPQPTIQSVSSCTGQSAVSLVHVAFVFCLVVCELKSILPSP